MIRKFALGLVVCLTFVFVPSLSVQASTDPIKEITTCIDLQDPLGTLKCVAKLGAKKLNIPFPTESKQK